MPTTDELKSAWESEETKFIFDTNVLLKLYSYQPNTLDDFFSILTRLGNKIWIPHQVGLEFQNKRLDIKLREKQKFSDLEREIDNLLKTESKITQIFLKGRFPELDSATTDLFNKIRSLVEEYRTVLNRCNESQPNIRTHDEIREKIDSCFEGKVGSPFSKEELGKIYEAGEERYKNKIPPGFKDNTKNPDDDYFYKGSEYKRKFGDLILWKQIIKKAKDSDGIKNVIFITDDEKEDWWYIAKENGDKAIGPLANLTHEIIEEGNVSLFHMYNTSAFFHAAKEFLSVAVQDESINEIEHIHENEPNAKKALSYEDFDDEMFNRKIKNRIVSEDLDRIIKNRIVAEDLDRIIKHRIVAEDLDSIIKNRIAAKDLDRIIKNIIAAKDLDRMVEIDRVNRMIKNWKINYPFENDEDSDDE